MRSLRSTPAEMMVLREIASRLEAHVKTTKQAINRLHRLMARLSGSGNVVTCLVRETISFGVTCSGLPVRPSRTIRPSGCCMRVCVHGAHAAMWPWDTGCARCSNWCLRLGARTSPSPKNTIRGQAVFSRQVTRVCPPCRQQKTRRTSRRMSKRSWATSRT